MFRGRLNRIAVPHPALRRIRQRAPGLGGLAVSRLGWAGASRALLHLRRSRPRSKTAGMRTRRLHLAPLPRSAFAGFCFPPDVIVLSVRCGSLVLRAGHRHDQGHPGGGCHRSGCDVPERHGRPAPSGMAPHRAVRQQPRRGRSWPPEGAAATDARTRAGLQRQGHYRWARLRPERSTWPLRTGGRGARNRRLAAAFDDLALAI
jgi:hypothetical protein